MHDLEGSCSRPPSLSNLSRKEWRRIMPFFRRNNSLESTKFLTVHKCQTKFTLSEAIDKLSNRNVQSDPNTPDNCGPKRRRTSLSSLESECKLAAERNAVWFGNDGRKLVHYFPHLISEEMSSEVIHSLIPKLMKRLFQRFRN